MFDLVRQFLTGTAQQHGILNCRRCMHLRLAIAEARQQIDNYERQIQHHAAQAHDSTPIPLRS